MHEDDMKIGTNRMSRPLSQRMAPARESSRRPAAGENCVGDPPSFVSHPDAGGIYQEMIRLALSPPAAASVAPLAATLRRRTTRRKSDCDAALRGGGSPLRKGGDPASLRHNHAVADILNRAPPSPKTQTVPPSRVPPEVAAPPKTERGAEPKVKHREDGKNESRPHPPRRHSIEVSFPISSRALQSDNYKKKEATQDKAPRCSNPTKFAVPDIEPSSTRSFSRTAEMGGSPLKKEPPTKAVHPARAVPRRKGSRRHSMSDCVPRSNFPPLPYFHDDGPEKSLEPASPVPSDKKSPKKSPKPSPGASFASSGVSADKRTPSSAMDTANDPLEWKAWGLDDSFPRLPLDLSEASAAEQLGKSGNFSSKLQRESDAVVARDNAQRSATRKGSDPGKKGGGRPKFVAPLEDYDAPDERAPAVGPGMSLSPGKSRSISFSGGDSASAASDRKSKSAVPLAAGGTPCSKGRRRQSISDCAASSPTLGGTPRDKGRRRQSMSDCVASSSNFETSPDGGLLLVKRPQIFVKSIDKVDCAKLAQAAECYKREHRAGKERRPPKRHTLLVKDTSSNSIGTVRTPEPPTPTPRCNAECGSTPGDVSVNSAARASGGMMVTIIDVDHETHANVSTMSITGSYVKKQLQLRERRRLQQEARLEKSDDATVVVEVPAGEEESCFPSSFYSDAGKPRAHGRRSTGSNFGVMKHAKSMGTPTTSSAMTTEGEEGGKSRKEKNRSRAVLGSYIHVDGGGSLGDSVSSLEVSARSSSPRTREDGPGEMTAAGLVDVINERNLIRSSQRRASFGGIQVPSPPGTLEGSVPVDGSQKSVDHDLFVERKFYERTRALAAAAQPFKVAHQQKERDGLRKQARRFSDFGGGTNSSFRRMV